MAPEFTHQGLRWRLDQRERAEVRAGALLFVGVIAMWVGWWVILRVMIAIAGGSIGEPIRVAMVAGPVVGNFVAVVVGIAVHRSSWTEIVADPHHLVIVRPWPLKGDRWAWSAIRKVRGVRDGLVIEADRVVRLERGAETIDMVREVGGWLDDTRQNAIRAAEAGGPPRPMLPPRELLELLERR
jgi:hypothetical protein